MTRVAQRSPSKLLHDPLKLHPPLTPNKMLNTRWSYMAVRLGIKQNNKLQINNNNITTKYCIRTCPQPQNTALGTITLAHRPYRSTIIWSLLLNRTQPEDTIHHLYPSNRFLTPSRGSPNTMIIPTYHLPT